MKTYDPLVLTLKAFKLNLDSRDHLIAYIHPDCEKCLSEGLRADERIRIWTRSKSIIATLRIFNDDSLKHDKIGLSNSAWKALGLTKDSLLKVSLSAPVESFRYVRGRMYGKPFKDREIKEVISDISKGRYSDVQLSSFITTCMHLEEQEIIYLTKAMSSAGGHLTWTRRPIVDKHCIGGVPGNRTTMILVPLLAAFGLIFPKTSSRSITSCSGTADTMEVFAPVELTTHQMKKVVEKEGGCIVWGGAVNLSPADDYLVRIEKRLDIDNHSQLLASILSKKLSAGSTHILIDIPIGKHAKIRSRHEAKYLSRRFLEVAKAVGLTLQIVETDGSQPIGRGLGPVLEALDVLSVLRCERAAPQDLRDKSLFLARDILEAWGGVPRGEGLSKATALLEDGHALRKFEAICKAQGGMKMPTLARYTRTISSLVKGTVIKIENQQLAHLAKLAGAPDMPAAGLEMHVKLGYRVEKGDPLFTLYAESKGDLEYAFQYFSSQRPMIKIDS